MLCQCNCLFVLVEVCDTNCTVHQIHRRFSSLMRPTRRWCDTADLIGLPPCPRCSRHPTNKPRSRLTLALVRHYRGQRNVGHTVENECCACRGDEGWVKMFVKVHCAPLFVYRYTCACEHDIQQNISAKINCSQTIDRYIQQHTAHRTMHTDQTTTPTNQPRHTTYKLQSPTLPHPPHDRYILTALVNGALHTGHSLNCSLHT